MAKRKTESTEPVEEVKCMFPDCTNMAHTRGLCKNHYQAAMKLLKKHPEVTWATLEASGKCLPAKRLSRVADYFLS